MKYFLIILSLGVWGLNADARDPCNKTINAKVTEITSGMLVKGYEKMVELSVRNLDAPVGFAQGDRLLRLNPRDDFDKELLFSIRQAVSDSLPLQITVRETPCDVINIDRHKIISASIKPKLKSAE